MRCWKPWQCRASVGGMRCPWPPYTPSPSKPVTLLDGECFGLGFPQAVERIFNLVSHVLGECCNYWATREKKKGKLLCWVSEEWPPPHHHYHHLRLLFSLATDLQGRVVGCRSFADEDASHGHWVRKLNFREGLVLRHGSVLSSSCWPTQGHPLPGLVAFVDPVLRHLILPMSCITQGTFSSELHPATPSVMAPNPIVGLGLNPDSTLAR